MTDDDFGARLGERRTRLHRQAQKKLTPGNVGENVTFDGRGRLAVRKAKHVVPPGAQNSSLLSDYEEAGADAASNAAQHNVAIDALNDLYSDVLELRRVVTDLRASLRASKLME